jgi:hypothetical protein
MDAFDGKDAKFGKRAKNCEVCKGKYRIRLPTPPKKQLPVCHNSRRWPKLEREWLCREGRCSYSGPNYSEAARQRQNHSQPCDAGMEL